jgi:hypothetical protein
MNFSQAQAAFRTFGSSEVVKTQHGRVAASGQALRTGRFDAQEFVGLQFEIALGALDGAESGGRPEHHADFTRGKGRKGCLSTQCSACRSRGRCLHGFQGLQTFVGLSKSGTHCLP